jgi:hypothetical protein
MISDVLFEACQEIERYQRDFDCYEGWREEIDVVRAVMANLQMRLDVPDPDEVDYAPKPILWKDMPDCELVRDYLRRVQTETSLISRYNEIRVNKTTAD